MAEARGQGLLDTTTDFTFGERMLAGAQLAHLEMVVDGRHYLLIGDPTRIVRCGSTRCVPDPGTAEAFAAFWQRFTDMAGWLGSEVGPATPYDPSRLGVLAIAPEPAQGGLHPRPTRWPLAAPFAQWGIAFDGSPADHCATVTGDDLARLLPAFRVANELSVTGPQWRRYPRHHWSGPRPCGCLVAGGADLPLTGRMAGRMIGRGSRSPVLLRGSRHVLG